MDEKSVYVEKGRKYSGREVLTYTKEMSWEEGGRNEG
jgi:hypothetical protein